MRSVTLVNYADDRFAHKGGVFRKAQERQCESALLHGVNEVVPWTFETLAETEFYRLNEAYLNRPCHLNGFAFKPFIVQQTLLRMRWGDIIIYYDSGDGEHLFDISVKPLIDMCLQNNGLLIHEWGDSNQRWTKRDCFYFMGMDTPECRAAVAIQATWFVFEKTSFVMDFVSEYLRYTMDDRIASYANDRVCGLPDLPGFTENRGDQSVLSILAFKHRLRTFPGAGGQANRIIGNFIKWHTLKGRCHLSLKMGAQRLAVRAGNLRHKMRRGQL